MNNYKHVFSPVRIGNVVLKNRITVSPMLPCLASPDGNITRELTEYYQGYARGGSAVVNLGDSCVDSVYGRSHYCELNIDTDKALGGLSIIAEAIHKFGAKASIELNHPGRMADSAKNNGNNPIAPSPIPAESEMIYAAEHGRNPSAITEMDQELIDHVIGKFTDAAARCLTAGFEMIMIHGGHGQLLSQFASSYSNKRSDKYGGTLENRSRFTNELLASVRNKVGDSLAIEYRISADEIIPEGMHLEETVEFIKLIQDKIDMVHLSVGMLSNPELVPYMAQPAYFPRAYNVHRAEIVKQAVKIPVACVGSITDLEIAEQIIAEGRADVIAMGRAHVADPDIVKKTYFGKAEDVRPCVRCNFCGERIPFSMPIRCAVNPVLGREIEHKYVRKADKRKRTVIVGGGPAGMQAAITASSRGHEVILFEKQERLGGAVITASSLPFKQDMNRYLDWITRQAKKSKTDIRLLTEATPGNIKAENPDVIIIAAGAEPVIPDIPGINSQKIVFAGDIDTGRASAGEYTAVVGAGMSGCETALYLAMQGKKVRLIDIIRENEYAGDASMAGRIALIALLHKENVEFEDETRLIEIRDNEAVFLKKGVNKTSGQFDTIVLSTGIRPLREITEELKDLAPEIFVIGDCNKPGNLKNAVHDGFNVAFEL